MRRNFGSPTPYSALFLALIGVSILLAGCGSISQVASDTQGENATASTTATPADQLTLGEVTLRLDKQRYSANNTVAVTIANGLSQTIWAEDHGTSCTVLVAEQAHAGAWDAVDNCHLMTPTRLMAVPPGATTARLGTSGWPAGAYRITLTYNSGDEGMGGVGGIVHSAEFTLG
jgi:uncharacterized protein YceK